MLYFSDHFGACSISFVWLCLIQRGTSTQDKRKRRSISKKICPSHAKNKRNTSLERPNTMPEPCYTFLISFVWHCLIQRGASIQDKWKQRSISKKMCPSRTVKQKKNVPWTTEHNGRGVPYFSDHLGVRSISFVWQYLIQREASTKDNRKRRSISKTNHPLTKEHRLITNNTFSYIKDNRVEWTGKIVVKGKETK